MGTTPCEYKFSTPGGRSIGSKGVSIFGNGNTRSGKGGDKENTIVLEVSPATADGGRQNFAMLAQLATGMDKGAGGHGEALEMCDLSAQQRTSGANSRRTKRRKNRQEVGENAQAIKGIQRALAERDVNNIVEAADNDMGIQRTPSDAADF